MKRRHYLGILSTVSTGITAGCLGGSGSEEPACSNGNSWSPNVRADILTLSPGDSDEIDIHIDSLSRFQLFGHLVHDSPAIDLSFDEEMVSPAPDHALDSSPPVWKWEECTSVDITLLVSASPDASSGDYEWGFSISEEIGNSHTNDFYYTISVN